MIGFDLLGASMDRPSIVKGGEWRVVNRNRRNVLGGHKWDILKMQNEGTEEGMIISYFFY